jgi:hypothetical protein
MSTNPSRQVKSFVDKSQEDGNFRRLSEFIGKNIVIYHAQLVRTSKGQPYKVVASVGSDYSDEQFYMFIGQTQPAQIMAESIAMGQFPLAFGVTKQKDYYLLTAPLVEDDVPF